MACAVPSVFARDASAGSGVLIEAVDDYSLCNGPSLQNSVADATGFANEIKLAGHGGFTGAGQYFNSAVWTSDFMDPERTGQADADGTYFDKPGLAFSYLAAHGGTDSVSDTCNWGCVNNQPCTSSSQCTTPPSGAFLPGFCRRHPGEYTGWCSYSANSRQIVLGNCTSGPSGRFGRANYSSGNVKWGESPNAGGWAGAGTNGGTNAVILNISHAQRSYRGHELFPAYAGVQLILTPLIHWGDTSMVNNRGYWFAKQAENPAMSVAYSWLAGMAALGSGAGLACTNTVNTPPTVVYGGGYGVNGCGGAISMGIGPSQSTAGANLWTSFNEIQNDGFDVGGSGYWANVFSCNYDCNTWSQAL